MSLDISVEFSPTFYKKINPDTIKKCIEATLNECGGEAEKECQNECPVVTGTLRDSHSTKASEDTVEIINDCGYAGYVAFGTSKQAPNNYPSRVVDKLRSEDFVSKTFEKKLKEERLT